MISAHPEIALVPEVRWLAQKYSSREGLTPDGRLTPAFFTQLRNLGRFSRVPLSPDELAELAANPSALTYAEFMTILYDAYGKARGKRLVGQKNADHAVPMDLDTVHALWPEAKVIHLIRDGRDVCLSVMNWRVQEAVARLFTTWGEHRVSTIAAWWEWQVRLMREAGNRIGAAQYREVHYDALVSNPEGTCTELCEFMGVPYDGAMLRFHENPPPRVREAKQSWLPPPPAVGTGARRWRPRMWRGSRPSQGTSSSSSGTPEAPRGSPPRPPRRPPPSAGRSSCARSPSTGPRLPSASSPRCFDVATVARLTSWP